MKKTPFPEKLQQEMCAFSENEVWEMMENELNKPPEEIDADLVAEYAVLLESAEAGKTRLIPTPGAADGKKKRLKKKKLFLFAAAAAILLAVAIPVSARFVRNDASEKLVQYDGERFSYNLVQGAAAADRHSDRNNEMIKKIREFISADIILPAELLTGKYEYSVRKTQEEEEFISVDVRLDDGQSGIYGYIGVTLFKDQETKIIYFSDVKATEQFIMSSQLSLNGMDVLIFGNDKYSSIEYLDRDVGYTIFLSDCPFETAVEIARSLDQTTNNGNERK